MDYLKESSNRVQMNHLQLFNRIPIVVKDPFLSNVKLENVVNKIQSIISPSFVDGLDSIYIGNFNFLDERELQALFLDNVIYVSSNQKNEDSCTMNIVHELAHLFADTYPEEVYGDGKLKKEFLSKRVWLYNFVISYFKNDTMPLSNYKNVEYDFEFDKFLYGTLGYTLLVYNTSAVFPNAYSITSLEEYFAVGFERFFCVKKDREYLRTICPVLYEKLFTIQEINS